jgi:hypothetical protein
MDIFDVGKIILEIGEGILTLCEWASGLLEAVTAPRQRAR